MEDEKGSKMPLELSLGVGNNKPIQRAEREKIQSVVSLDLSITLSPKETANNLDNQVACPRESNLKLREEKDECQKYKRGCSNNGNSKSHGKKLRLTNEQSSLLENCFNVQSTLSPNQKHTLAEQLNLTPRQVEVWFQNRRARTKVKQTEVNREYLKECCRSLSDENKRLKRELQELRSLKLGRSTGQNDHPRRAVLLATCRSCEKLALNTKRNCPSILPQD